MRSVHGFIVALAKLIYFPHHNALRKKPTRNNKEKSWLCFFGTVLAPVTGTALKAGHVPNSVQIARSSESTEQGP